MKIEWENLRKLFNSYYDMQLFICEQLKTEKEKLFIQNNKELLDQLRKVLRAKPWYEFFVQDWNWEVRYHVSLQSRNDKDIETLILGKEEWKKSLKKSWMLISFPNKQEKLELILQKLTEIWISDIFLRSSERSLLKELNDKKLQRITKIIKEAVEQSWWWQIPNLKILSSLDEIKNDWSMVVFDLPRNKENTNWKGWNKPYLWVIGPEGGLTDKDYEKFPKDIMVQSLWENVLRMETAAIIGARWLKNIK